MSLLFGFATSKKNLIFLKFKIINPLSGFTIFLGFMSPERLISFLSRLNLLIVCRL